MEGGAALSLDFSDGAEGGAGKVLLGWRVYLEKANRGERAALARLSDLNGCFFRPGFHELRRRLAPLADLSKPEDLTALAAVAILTARVKVGEKGQFEAASRLPRALRGRDRHPVFSELRLQRLLEERDPADLHRHLRRALAQIKGRVDPRDLADWTWGLAHPRLHDQTARRFAQLYYGAGDPKLAPADGPSIEPQSAAS